MGDENPFLILKFYPTDKDPQEYIDVGLIKWLIGDPDDKMNCDSYWPLTNAEKAIKLQLSHQENWKICAVQVLRCYDTYLKARAAVPKFIEDSHYETENPCDLGRFKRKKFRKIQEISSDEETPVIKRSKKSIPSPPAISQAFTQASDSKKGPKKVIPAPPAISQVSLSQAAVSGTAPSKSKHAPSSRSSRNISQKKEAIPKKSNNKSQDNELQLKIEAAKSAAQEKMKTVSGITSLKPQTPREKSKSIEIAESKFSRPRLVNQESIDNARKVEIQERLEAGRAAAEAMLLSPSGGMSVRSGGMTSPWSVTNMSDTKVNSPALTLSPTLSSAFSPLQYSVSKSPKRFFHDLDDQTADEPDPKCSVSKSALGVFHDLDDQTADEPEEITLSDSPVKINPMTSQSLLGDSDGSIEHIKEEPISPSLVPKQPAKSKHLQPVKSKRLQPAKSSYQAGDIAALEHKVDLISKMVNNNNVAILKLHNKVDTLLSNNGKLLRKLIPHEKLKPPTNMPSLPVQDWKEFKNLEEFLTNGAHEVAVVDYLSNYVVKDVEEAEKKSVRQVLQNTFNNKVAEQFNLDGGNSKKSFRKTNTYKVFQGCLVSAFKDVNLQKFDIYAQTWLKDAAWRKGGSKCSNRASLDSV